MLVSGHRYFIGRDRRCTKKTESIGNWGDCFKSLFHDPPRNEFEGIRYILHMTRDQSLGIGRGLIPYLKPRAAVK